MKRLTPAIALLFGSLALVTLGGCERIEQARQSTAEALQEAARTGSLESARQKAAQALQEAKQQTAGMLGEASEYLGGPPPADDADAPAGKPAITAL